MTARITSGQVNQVKKLVGDALTALNPTKDGMQRVFAKGEVLQKLFKHLVFALAGEFFVLLSDEEAIAWIIKWAKKSQDEARQIVTGWRNKARAHGIADTVMIHAEVRPGGTFKHDLPLMGPCWDGFSYLQGWDFPDPPTEHCLLSWVPVPLQDSADKNVDEQCQLITAFKNEAALSAWYEVSFGAVGHVGGLALAHFDATGKDPFGDLVVRTDTCIADGLRLKLYWPGESLDCGYWGDDGYRYPGLGVFAVGVVKALGH